MILLPEESGPEGTYTLLDKSNNYVFGTWTSKILFEDNIHNDEAEFDINWKQFASDNPFKTDWLGACFYLLSRYEEYIDHHPDKHGRFNYKNSKGNLYHFLERPIVEEVALNFLQSFMSLETLNGDFDIKPTLDIDMTHSIKGKGFKRIFGGFISDFLKFKWSNMLFRWKVLTNRENDPFDTFDYQLKVFEKNVLSANYFIQCGKYSRYDKNLDPNNKYFRKTVNLLKRHHYIGVHYSYYSSENPAYFITEKTILETKLSGMRSFSSRQHYLRMKFGETQQYLINAGIREDYTMGYSETIGYRAGISRPFNYFNLKENVMTSLRIVPFSVMDVALQHYQQKSPKEAIEKIKEMKQLLKNLNGTFCFCFHNETLSEKNQWKGWRKVFEEACKII
jgi:hypothetical protein